MSDAAPAAVPSLLSEDAVTDYRAAMHLAVDTVADLVASADRPYSGADPAALTQTVSAVDLDRPLGSVEAALGELRSVWLDSAVWFHHPRYLSHLNCPVLVSSLAADALASAVNTSMDTWDQSAAATQLERQVVAWTAQRIGFDGRADGIFTSGGTASNQQALTLARQDALERAGLPVAPEGFDRLRVLATDQSHFSVNLATRTLGLRPDAVVTVPTDETHRMEPTALRAQLDRLAEADLVPMAVVATAGTTDLGVVDPLVDIAAVCAAAGVWLHVDAAYGGGLLTSRRHRGRLAGIHLADSVTIDFHKTWFQPVAASAVLVRDGAALRHVAHHADYLNPVRTDPRRAAMPDQVGKSLQTTRRFDALKVWTSLRVEGADAIGAMLDRVIDLAGEVADLVEDDPRLRLAQRPALSTVLFRFEPEGTDPLEADRVADEVVTRLLLAGTAMIARTRLDGQVWLKLTLLNPRTSVEDVRAVLDEVCAVADDCARTELLEVAR